MTSLILTSATALMTYTATLNEFNITVNLTELTDDHTATTVLNELGIK